MIAIGLPHPPHDNRLVFQLDVTARQHLCGGNGRLRMPKASPTARFRPLSPSLRFAGG